jgi:aquaporin Z
MESFRKHLPEYLMEAAELGLFLVVAGLFASLFESPQSPIHQAISNGDVRRLLMGVVFQQPHGES